MHPTHELSDEEFDALIASEDLNQLIACRESLDKDYQEYSSKFDALHAASSLLDQKIAQEKAQAASKVEATPLFSQPAFDEPRGSSETTIQRLVRNVVERLKHYFRLPDQRKTKALSSPTFAPHHASGEKLSANDPAAVETKTSESDLSPNLNQNLRVVDVNKADERQRELAKQYEQVRAKLEVLRKRLDIVNARIEQLEKALAQVSIPQMVTASDKVDEVTDLEGETLDKIRVG